MNLEKESKTWPWELWITAPIPANPSYLYLSFLIGNMTQIHNLKDATVGTSTVPWALVIVENIVQLDVLNIFSCFSWSSWPTCQSLELSSLKRHSKKQLLIWKFYHSLVSK